jgi:DNA-binding transcriptional ArsR family regulator/protein-L-isoaspartate O-methyltransferase
LIASSFHIHQNQNFDDVDALTLLCKALADSLRLEILRLLRTESFGVLEICRIFDIRQSALSHHLKILATAGLVSTRREGNSIFYRRPLLSANDPFGEFKRTAFLTIDRVPLRDELRTRITLIQQERSERSLVFFTRQAHKFREKQGLIAERGHYEDNLLDLLQRLPLTARHRVMEVGPGTGELLARLARQFDEVVALDNSLEMLNQAKATVAAQQQNNVTFVHGDTHSAIAQGLRCDLLIYDMVLHHIPSPWEAFQDSAQILEDNGILILIDLSRHDQDWVRESCGDLWLGFENNDLEDWAAQAGLTSGPSVYLGLRNGFQIQMRVFVRAADSHLERKRQAEFLT